MPHADRPAASRLRTPRPYHAVSKNAGWLPAHALLLALTILAGMGPARAASPSELTATAAPSFSLPTRDGTTVSLESLKGKVILVDFWASWCGPCQKSFPWLASLHQRFADKGLTIVAVNLDKKREAAETFLQKVPAPFLVAFDPSGKTADAYKVTALPSTYLVGPTGSTLVAHVGYDPKKTDEIEALIQKACAP
jgi:cytochrome c biogenesis protein CcmG/thiol:disulfide interchange protein DsbE